MACSRPELAPAPGGGSWPSNGRQGARRRTLPVAFLRLVLRFYGLMISPLLGQNCRFEPSCSRFAEQALDHHGLASGAWMALKRLLRCHPWHTGGFDPVP